jgi:hypothetical protein
VIDMAWYPDWVVALDEVAKGIEGARVTRRNAEDAVREIKKLQAKITALEEEARRERRAAQGSGLFSR